MKKHWAILNFILASIVIALCVSVVAGATFFLAKFGEPQSVWLWSLMK